LPREFESQSEGTKFSPGNVSKYFKKVARFISEEIKSESRSIADEQLKQATGKLDSIVEGLREAAGKFRERQNNSLADIVDMGSESITRLSDNIRSTSPEKLVDDVKDFAHRQPGVFLGAAVVGGFLLGQIFSTPRESSGTAEQLPSRKESSIEYMPGNDEEEYYVPH
jgi:ElaB/YqjD/DUF883 family membrane-anchored ribosome-binding protein